MLGRWSSNAYQLYIKTPRDQLVSVFVGAGQQARWEGTSFGIEYERDAHHSEANVGVTAWTKGGGGVMCIMSRPVWDCRCMVLCVCMSC